MAVLKLVVCSGALLTCLSIASFAHAEYKDEYGSIVDTKCLLGKTSWTEGHIYKPFNGFLWRCDELKGSTCMRTTRAKIPLLMTERIAPPVEGCEDYFPTKEQAQAQYEQEQIARNLKLYGTEKHPIELLSEADKLRLDVMQAEIEESKKKKAIYEEKGDVAQEMYYELLIDQQYEKMNNLIYGK